MIRSIESSTVETGRSLALDGVGAMRNRGIVHLLGKTDKITALVVDDDTVNQKIHHKMLERLGIDIQVVCNGKEAVDIHSSGKNFDLILMDMDMPIMDGIQATRKLREMGIASVIAGVTTRTMEAEKKEFMEAGLDDFQEKPLTLPKLLSILHKLKHFRL